MIRLFNTLSKTTEEFNPLDENHARIYSCGPTVYDHAHIGNLASFIYADTLRRALVSAGLQVKHTMNLTDVDDKTIKRSLSEDHTEEPKAALTALTTRYADIFLEDMEAIGNDVQALTIVRATDHIEAMQTLIRALVDAGTAYVAEDGVYFSIQAYKASGKTYGQLLTIDAGNTSAERIDNDEYDKESVHDFALWKTRRDDEPYWQFEIDGKNLDGRPGWHIECSAMSEATLGLPFDIHTGGIDLIFPHHENEIAQSTAIREDGRMAQLFFHSEHVLVDGKKMSKSLGNFFTLEDITAKGFDPLAFRLLVLSSHYRSQSNFTYESLQAAQTKLKDIRAWADLRFQNFESSDLQSNYVEAMPKLLDEMQDDLKTQEALKHLYGIINRTSEIGIDSKTISELLPLIESLFGLKLLERQDINQSQKELLNLRQAARAAGDWQRSDELRDELHAQAIIVKDTNQGQVWERA